MMRVVLCLAILLGCVLMCKGEDAKMAIGPDPRVDLLATVFCLAESPEYQAADPASPYGQAFAKKFERFKSHPVVKMAADFRSQYGVSYNAVTSYALGLDSMTTLNLRPGSLETLDRRWPREKLPEFSAALQNFAKETDFMTFYNENVSCYDDAITFYRELMDYSGGESWLRQFFRGVPFRQSIVLAMQIRGGYLMSDQDGQELDCHFVMGVRTALGRFDKLSDRQKLLESAFVVDGLIYPMVYQTLLKYEPQLAETAGLAFELVKRKIQRQFCSTPADLMYKTFNHAITAVYLADHFGSEAARQKLTEDNDNGFELVSVVYQAIDDARKKDGKDWSFVSSLELLVAAVNRPEVKTMIEAAARQRLEKQPQIVSVTPANESQNVDPATTVITVVFDRPMNDKSWSVCQRSPELYPEIKKLSYNKSCTVLTMEVVLKPEHDYLMDFNSGRYRGFVSREMQPLEDYPYRFTTGKAKTATP